MQDQALRPLVSGPGLYRLLLFARRLWEIPTPTWFREGQWRTPPDEDGFWIWIKRKINFLAIRLCWHVFVSVSQSICFLSRFMIPVPTFWGSALCFVVLNVLFCLMFILSVCLSLSTNLFYSSFCPSFLFSMSIRLFLNLPAHLLVGLILLSKPVL